MSDETSAYEQMMKDAGTSQAERERAEREAQQADKLK